MEPVLLEYLNEMENLNIVKEDIVSLESREIHVDDLESDYLPRMLFTESNPMPENFMVEVDIYENSNDIWTNVRLYYIDDLRLCGDIITYNDRMMQCYFTL